MKLQKTSSRLTQILCLALAAVMLVMTLAGCGSESPAAIIVGDVRISSNMFCYWMSRYKAMFLYAYFGTTTDNSQYWTAQLADGVTAGDFLEALAISNIKSNAVCLKLFEDYGLQLSKDEINAVDEKVNQKISAAGSKSALNSALSAYGANVNVLREVYLAEAKLTALQSYLFGDNGIMKVTDAELDAYYKENYYHDKHILVLTAAKYVTDAEGNPEVDSSTGAYKTEELSEEEKAAKIELAADLEKRIAAGEDFDALVAQYTEDLGMQHFKNGYYFTSASTYLPTDVINAVKELKIGDVQTVETTAGIYIVKRYELEDKAYADENLAAMFSDMSSAVTSIKLQNLVAEHADEIVTNDEIIADYPLAYCTANFYY